MRPHALTLGLALLLTFAPLPARADAGGPDAPSGWDQAVPLLPGRHEGSLGGDDAADWYRVELPAGKGARVVASSEAEGRGLLHLLGDDGRWLGGASFGGPGAGRVEGAAAGAVRVGVVAPWRDAPGNGTEPPAPSNYTLEVTLFDVADHAVRGLRVLARGLQTDVASVPAGTLRTVEVDVENLAARGGGHVVVYAETPSDGRYRHVASAWLELEAGGARTLSFDWDARGLVGDVVVHAYAAARHDPVPENGHQAARHYVLVGGTGEGFGLSGAGRCAGLPDGSACAYAWQEGDAVQLGADRWGEGGFTAAGVRADRRGADAWLHHDGAAWASAGVHESLAYGGSAWACAQGPLGGACHGAGLP